MRVFLVFLIALPLFGQDLATLRAIRNKISAGDLRSAESLLEVHKSSKGEDGEYLLCVGWVARGAALMRDWNAAAHYGQIAHGLALPKVRSGGFEKEPDAVSALGAAITVEAERLLATGKKKEAIRYLERSLREFQDAPVAFRSRIRRTLNLMGLTGRKAPYFASVGEPVVLFLWAEWCGDCKAQAASLRHVVDKFGSKVKFIAPTRLYEADPVAERERVARVWRESYRGLESVKVEIHEEAMVAYGVSATPTFVMIDRKGIVRMYSPTRLTEERLTREIEKLLRLP